MSDLFGNHIVGFPTRRLISYRDGLKHCICISRYRFYSAFVKYHSIDDDDMPIGAEKPVKDWLIAASAVTIVTVCMIFINLSTFANSFHTDFISFELFLSFFFFFFFFFLYFFLYFWLVGTDVATRC